MEPGLDFSLPQELAGRYVWRRRLGAGSFGTVDAVYDLELERELALKRIIRDTSSRDQTVDRFVRECKILAKIQHPHILTLVSAGIDSESPWLLTELLSGHSLETMTHKVRGEKVLREVAQALDAIHALGIVHRDVKPANLFLTSDDRIVLLDLGLARPVDSSSLPHTGSILGSPAYLPPEAFRNQTASETFDWYALGVSVFEIMEKGRRPYTGPELLQCIQGKAYPKPTFRIGDPESFLGRTVLALLDPDPLKRPSSFQAIQKLAPTTRRSSHTTQAPRSLKASSASPSTEHQDQAKPKRFPPLLPWMALLCVGLVLGANLSSFPTTPKPPSPHQAPSSEALPIVPPSPALKKRARHFEAFRIQSPFIYDDEELYVQVLTQVGLSNFNAISQRWRGYIFSLNEWLEANEAGCKTSDDLDRLLLSSDLETETRKLLLDMPSGYIQICGGLLSYLIHLKELPQNPELSRILDKVIEEKSLFIAVYNEATDLASTWYKGTSPLFRESQFGKLLYHSWFGKNSIHRERHPLKGLLRKAAPAAPLGAASETEEKIRRLYIRQCAEYLSSHYANNELKCSTRAQGIQEVLDNPQVASFGPEEKYRLYRLLNLACVRTHQCYNARSEAKGQESFEETYSKVRTFLKIKRVNEKEALTKTPGLL